MPKRIMPLLRAPDFTEVGDIFLEEDNSITYINFRPEYENLNDGLRNYGFEIRPVDATVIMRPLPAKVSEPGDEMLKAAARILVQSGVHPYVAETAIANLLLSGFVIRRTTIKDANIPV